MGGEVPGRNNVEDESATASGLVKGPLFGGKRKVGGVTTPILSLKKQIRALNTAKVTILPYLAGVEGDQIRLAVDERLERLDIELTEQRNGRFGQCSDQ